MKEITESKFGFTLIELLVVIAIVGILAAIVLVNTAQSKKNANDGAISSSLTQIKNAAEVHYNEFFDYTGVCDGAGNLNTSIVDFNRINSYIDERNGSSGIIVCRSNVVGWAVASSLNNGGCWCVDYEGRSKQFVLSPGQNCGDVLITVVCP